MKKGFWIGLIAVFAITIIVGSLIKYWDSPDIDKIISLVGVIISAGAIIFVVRNTNRQIQNQNKENHRPYLVAKRIKSIDASINKEIVYSIYVFEEEDRSSVEIKTCISLSNLGYGIAANLKAFSCTDKFRISAHNIARRNVITDYSEVSIKKNDKCYTEFTINMKSYTYKKGESIPILLFYSDLNLNVYSLLIDIIKLRDKYIVGHCFQIGTKPFHSQFEDLDAYNQRKKQYIDEVYGYDY